MKLLSVPKAGDPSEIQQQFFSLPIKLVCCRYWKLTHWESRNMEFPYWRLYWNKNRGAYITYKRNVYALGPENIVLIAPHTSFSTSLQLNPNDRSSYVLQGERIGSGDNESILIRNNYVLHLYIHFNLGIPFDSAPPGIYTISVHDIMSERLNRITSFLATNYDLFTLNQNIDIHTLIFESLCSIPNRVWESVNKDEGIIKVLQIIENSLQGDLSNPVLARHAGMAVNSFIRKFTVEVGVSPQLYVQQKRIEKAEISLLYSDERIDEIARICGYRDRFYFSRAFKNYKLISPGAYRNRYRQKGDMVHFDENQ